MLVLVPLTIVLNVMFTGKDKARHRVRVVRIYFNLIIFTATEEKIAELNFALYRGATGYFKEQMKE